VYVFVVSIGAVVSAGYDDGHPHGAQRCQLYVGLCDVVGVAARQAVAGVGVVLTSAPADGHDLRGVGLRPQVDGESVDPGLVVLLPVGGVGQGVVSGDGLDVEGGLVLG
jgi:hypothetical protein